MIGRVLASPGFVGICSIIAMIVWGVVAYHAWRMSREE